MGFKYKAGLFLIVTVIAMWVTSCEVTQGILEDYEYPFAVTYLGTSFLALHLPLAFLKIWLASLFKRLPKRNSDTSDQSSTDTMSAFELEHRVSISQRENASSGFETREEPPDKELTNRNLATIAACIAPIWFLTEYFTNAALAETTVARTTILVSTSGLFTLFIGAAMGVESVNVAKVISVIISMAGVAMTMLGKTWVPGNSHSKTSLNGKHSLIGDLYALLSAMIYGLFTVLLKKHAGVEGQKVDIQKLYGFIGLFILLTLWWLVWPLTAMGMEPKFTIPHSAKMAEIIVANCFVGSFLPDYFLALGIVWTSPLVNESLDPVWNQTFDFLVENGLNDMLVLEVFDHDTFGKDYMGRCIVTLTRVIMEGEYKDSLPLEGGAKKGKLNISLKWTSQTVYRNT